MSRKVDDEHTVSQVMEQTNRLHKVFTICIDYVGDEYGALGLGTRDSGLGTRDSGLGTRDSGLGIRTVLASQ
jgi:hypothetical protein